MEEREKQTQTTVDYAAKKRRIILMLLAYSAIYGVLCIFLPNEDSPLDFLAVLPMLILSVSWCFLDATEHDYRIGRLMVLTLVLLFIVGFPIYVFRTRGIRGFKTLLLTTCLAAVMVACAFSTLYMGFALGWVE